MYGILHITVICARRELCLKDLAQQNKTNVASSLFYLVFTSAQIHRCCCAIPLPTSRRTLPIALAR